MLKKIRQFHDVFLFARRILVTWFTHILKMNCGGKIKNISCFPYFIHTHIKINCGGKVKNIPGFPYFVSIWEGFIGADWRTLPPIFNNLEYLMNCSRNNKERYWFEIHVYHQETGKQEFSITRSKYIQRFKNWYTYFI